MPSRMERYDSSENNIENSRLSKNKKLYDELYTNASYTEFTELHSDNVMDLNAPKVSSASRREEYQKSRNFSGVLGKSTNNVRNYDVYSSYSFMEPTHKNYDINTVLEDAKKSRGEIDELERKRKLRTTEYNILADLTEEKLKEHQQKKKEVLSKQEEAELEELIYTITSNTMRQEIDNELLGDLMPTDADETIVSENLSQQLENLQVSNSIEENDTTSDFPKLDDSFYTKSMDLSDQDLLPSDEEDVSFRDVEKNGSKVVKILITIVILALIVVVGIIIYYAIVGGK